MEAVCSDLYEVAEKEKCMKKMSRLTQRPPVNIEFQDLSYTLKFGEKKQILKSMTGKFCAGELTAILGPSGGGKTTLLNILAGYTSDGVTGNIKINNKPRKMKVFHKISAYIMQEDLLQPYLTVGEAMMIAAKLKLGNDISLENKSLVVEEVLAVLGLETCFDTMMECLSGGQRKRLSIALEMVNNPPVIFLDEPTSGLDTVSIKQCIDVLRTITGQGRTVICTIHQPSVAIFQQFNQVYFLADGMCVYNGSTSDILPFLSSIGVNCPTTYSPCEYVIEIVQTSQELIPVLVTAIQNGKLNRRNSSNTNHFNERSSIKTSVRKKSLPILDSNLDVNFASSFWTQFYILFGRMLLQMRRNKLMLGIQLFHHTLSGLLFGILFFGIGNDAAMAIANFKLCVSVVIFFVYTYLMSPVLLFPTEVAMLKREYFNRWYGLKAYFLALTLRSFPLMMSLGLAFLGITYVMTDQPMELDRFVWFALVGLLVAIATEGLGIAIGSVCSITNGSVVAPAIAAPLIFFCIYGMGYGSTIEPSMKIAMSTSYIRYALEAIVQAVYNDRSKYERCDELYCHYKDPKHLLRDLGMLDKSYNLNILGLSFFLLLFRLIAFISLRYRLTSEFSNTIVNYVTKIFKHR